MLILLLPRKPSDLAAFALFYLFVYLFLYVFLAGGGGVISFIGISILKTVLSHAHKWATPDVIL